MPTLIMMGGVPGSGKSTWAKRYLEAHAADTKYVSRDEVRFSMIGENEPYFSKETDVYKQFVNLIDMHLQNGYNVIADATHLNCGSRNKLLNFLEVQPDEIEFVWIKVPLEVALAQNENRKGTRAYVPPEQVRKMFYAFRPVSSEECFDSVTIVEREL